MALRQYARRAGLSSVVRFAGSLAIVTLVTACGHATRSASPQKVGKAGLTAATVGARIERVLVAEDATIAMVARKGCLASVQTAQDQVGTRDELRVRCPKPDRMRAWFDGVDRLVANVAVEPAKEDESDDAKMEMPSAELVTGGGAIVKVVNRADASRLAAEVRALSAELAAVEVPSPGPASPAGWQMLRVLGPAHVVFAGDPARGMLEAKMSTNGQYFCEFVTHTNEGPIRATKSGWISETTAAKAIDEVLVPFKAIGPDEKARATFVAATSEGAERKADATSTPAVVERFEAVQDALGDACLPELEPPAPPVTGL